MVHITIIENCIIVDMVYTCLAFYDRVSSVTVL